MHRQQVLQALRDFQTPDRDEAAARDRIVDFVTATPDCFQRHHAAGHVTGSALLIHRESRSFLLNHHRFLKLWLSFGGHADGDGDIAAVARRETEEESGISDLRFSVPGIFDVDVHGIPENPGKNEPAHFHYDIAYLLETPVRDFAISDESLALKWVTYNEALALPLDQRMRRIVGKAQEFMEKGVWI